MKLFDLHNTLMHRRLLPPPISTSSVNTPSYKASLHALLHSAYTRVGRVSLCLIATFALSFTSCEKDIITPEDTLHTHMQAYYVESRGLTETSADSVVNYYTKFAGFHNQHPECEADEYFPPIVHNLDSAFTHFGIVQIGNIIVKTEWDGEIFINF